MADNTSLGVPRPFDLADAQSIVNRHPALSGGSPAYARPWEQQSVGQGGDRTVQGPASLADTLPLNMTLRSPYSDRPLPGIPSPEMPSVGKAPVDQPGTLAGTLSGVPSPGLSGIAAGRAQFGTGDPGTDSLLAQYSQMANAPLFNTFGDKLMAGFSGLAAGLQGRATNPLLEQAQGQREIQLKQQMERANLQMRVAEKRREKDETLVKMLQDVAIKTPDPTTRAHFAGEWAKKMEEVYGLKIPPAIAVQMTQQTMDPKQYNSMLKDVANGFPDDYLISTYHVTPAQLQDYKQLFDGPNANRLRRAIGAVPLDVEQQEAIKAQGVEEDTFFKGHPEFGKGSDFASYAGTLAWQQFKKPLYRLTDAELAQIAPAARQMDVEAERKKKDADAQRQASLKRVESAARKQEQLWDPKAVEIAAQEFYRTGKLPPMGFGSAGVREQVMLRVDEIRRQHGDTMGQMVTRQGNYAALSATLKQEQERRAKIVSFEDTAGANLRMVLDQLDRLKTTKSPIFNKWLLQGRNTVVGDPDVADIMASILVARTETARVLNSPTGAGVLTNEARAEVESVLSAAQNPEQIRRVISRLEADMESRKRSLDRQVDVITHRMQGDRLVRERKTGRQGWLPDGEPVPASVEVIP